MSKIEFSRVFKTLSLSLAAALVINAGASDVFAESVGAQLSPKEFKRADSNGDGKITLEEFDDYVISLFSIADINHDKYLDLKESGEAATEDFAKLDLNQDKRLSFQEVMRKAHMNFRSADTNSDKMVSMKEARSFSS